MNKIKHTACFAISPFLLKLTFLLEHSHNYAEGSRIDLRFSSNWCPGAADGLACENSRVSPRSSPLDTRLAGCVGGGGGGLDLRGSVSSPPSEFRSLLSELSDRISVLMT